MNPAVEMQVTKLVGADVEVAAPGQRNRRVMIVALARKLLVALWKFGTTGIIPEGAVVTAA